MLEIFFGVLAAIAAWQALKIVGRIFLVAAWPVQFFMALTIPPGLAIFGAYLGLWDPVMGLLVVSPLTALVLVFYIYYGPISWARDWLFGDRNARSRS